MFLPFKKVHWSSEDKNVTKNTFYLENFDTKLILKESLYSIT